MVTIRLYKKKLVSDTVKNKMIFMSLVVLFDEPKEVSFSADGN